MNLPTYIDLGGKGNILYIYDATGRKVRKLVQDDVLTQNKQVDYADGFQYENNILQFFPTAEGYASRLTTKIDLTGRMIKIPIEELPQDQFSYVYNYTDHLGNIRLSYSLDPNTQQLKIVEQNHYYPFGMRHTNYSGGKMVMIKDDELKRMAPATEEFLTYKYKYNGKEFQDELGLNLYDYGARNYDAALGRWMNVDPLAETSRRWNPYTYCYNNPLRFIDPDGMQATPPDEYYINRDGSINTLKTNESFDRFYTQNKEGNYELVSELHKFKSGLVQIPVNHYGVEDMGGNSTNPKEKVGFGDNYVKPETAAALYGLINELNDLNISISFGDMSSINGSDPWNPGSTHHAGHGHLGNRSGLDVDFRYINNDGESFKDPNATTSKDFNIEKNTAVFKIAEKFGFTKNFQGNEGQIKGVTKANGHNDHGHLGLDYSSINWHYIKTRPINNSYFINFKW